MSAASPGQNEHYLTVFRRHFRTWRGDRPFWAGLFVLLGGFPIAYFPYANLQLGHLTLAMSTTAGAGSLIIGVLLVVLGVSLWFQKHVRTFAGVAAILLALVSIPVSNLGGFLIGFLFAMIGGAMAVSWVPGEPAEEQRPAPAPRSEAPEPVSDVPAPHGDASDPLSKGEASESAAAGPAAANGVGEPNDLSGTSPSNGANGRQSAG
ncbi:MULTISPECIES: DUF6114 domain-containing protein [Streptomyces]|uniref:Integral membrane protein n=1 Tax=Streptomyces dengpaensis TaxID=2049881 RepID=A0ABN5HZ87_9ACTN|nr:MULTISPECIES: DUF6114 domain-containing protein [Streptomyces]AVH56410.1 hypothetical protein C4B68_12210 [Streptomyces dengpaensis]PIB10563.1 hypothetical protein B1C81_08885 [Streptomyces sp. HG99]